MKRLVVTTYFPNDADPQRSVYVLNWARAMTRLCEISVVSPVRHVPGLAFLPGWHRTYAAAHDERLDGIEVRRPRFVGLPGFHWLSGLTYSLAIRSRVGEVLGPELVLHGHCVYPDGVAVALAARHFGAPYVLTAHGSDINVYADHRALRPQIRWALRHARGVIAVSAALLKKIQALVAPQAPPVAHIPCAGFWPGLFSRGPRSEARARLDLGDGRIVLFAGNLVAIKGLDVLLDAWARLRSDGFLATGDRLILLGEGEAAHDLHRRAAALGGSVEFRGSVPYEQIPCWMSAADVLCLPSRNEGTPNVIVEALASGTPVVASAVGGVPEIVTDGENGVLVAPGDAFALGGALRSALTRAWDRDALHRSVAHLSWDRLAQQDQRFVQTVLGRPGA